MFPLHPSQYIYEKGNHPVTNPSTELVEDALEYLEAMSQDEITQLVERFPPGIKIQVDGKYELGNRESLKRIAIYTIVAKVQNLYFSFANVVNC